MSKLTLVPKFAAQGILGIVVFCLYIFLYLLFIGAVVTGGLAVYNRVFDHKSNNSNSTTPLPYVATEDNFQIDFPGTPSITDKNSSGNGVTDVEHEYNLSQNNDEYIVNVENISGASLSSQSETNQQQDLQTLLNDLGQQYPARVSNSLLTTFKGYNAITSSLNYTKNNQDLSGSTVIFIDGNRLFTIVGWGLSQDEFKSFANSFSTT